MEASIKCEIPKDALMLRHILQLANRCHSIALHDILILPDFYIPGTETKINPFTAEEPVRTVAKRIQRLREIARPSARLPVEKRSTRATRVSVVCTGTVSEQAKTKMYDLAKEGLTLAHDQAEFMIAVIRDYHKRDFVDVGGMKVALPKDPRFPRPGLPCNPRVLWQLQAWTRYPDWDLNRFKEARPWDWYMGEMEVTLEEPTVPDWRNHQDRNQGQPADGSLHRHPDVRRPAR